MRIGTLFSGIGAPEQGAKRVYDDLELVFACEFDKYARQSFQANYDIEGKHFHIDVNDMDGKQYNGHVDIIIGGSPCQDFSIAGLRAGIDGHRGQLIWQYYRIIMEAQPEIFIYENVKGMVSDKGGKTLDDFLTVFRESGYYCHHAVLNTKDYGVPQNRERIYIVGFKDHELYHRFQFAKKIKLEKRLRCIIDEDVDEYYYVGDKSFQQFLENGILNINIDQNVKSIGNTHPSGSGMNGNVYCTSGISPTLTTNKGEGIKVLSATENGHEIANSFDSINYSFIDSKTRRGRVGKQVAQTLDTLCRQAVLEPSIVQKPRGYNNGGKYNISPTLSSNSWHENNYLYENYTIRRLTPRECLRLQDFPDTFKQVVSNSQMYKQAGNSMSVNILEMIFRQIEKAKAQEPTNTLMDFLHD